MQADTNNQTPPTTNEEMVDALLVEAEARRHPNPAEALQMALDAVRLARADNYMSGVAAGLTVAGRVCLILFRLDDAEAYLTDALYLATELGNTEIKGRVNSALGTLQMERNNYSQALPTMRNALALNREAHDTIGAFTSLNTLGRLYDNMGQYDLSLDMFQQALGNCRVRGNRFDEALIMGNVGVMYWNRDDLLNSIHWTQQALDILRTLDSTPLRGLMLANLSDSYCRIGQYAQARLYVNECLALDSGQEEQRFIAIALNNLGAILVQEGKYGEADAAFARAGRIVRNLGDEYTRIAVLVDWASTYLVRGEATDCAPAKVLLEEAIEYAVRNEIPNWVYRAHHTLAQIYEREGDYAQALHHHKRYHAVKEKVFNEKSERQLQYLRVVMEM